MYLKEKCECKFARLVYVLLEMNAIITQLKLCVGGYKARHNFKWMNMTDIRVRKISSGINEWQAILQNVKRNKR